MSACEKKSDEIDINLKPLAYKLPNGDILDVEGKCQTTDLFFRGQDNYGVQNLILDAIFESPLDYQVELADSIVLAGGTTKMDNFIETFWDLLDASNEATGKNVNFNIIENDQDD